MARPTLPLGTPGNITVTQLAPGRYRARCRFRDYDGVTRPVERHGKSKQDARGNLNEHLKERKRVGDADITPATLFKFVAATWMDHMENLMKAGERSPNSYRSYRMYLKSSVLPAFGELRIQEVTAGRVDKFIKEITSKNGSGAARMCRAVTSGVMALAVRHDAASHNPAREASPIVGSAPKRKPRAMTLTEVAEMRGKVLSNETDRRRDLPDLIDFMLATGMRSAEACAVSWDALDLKERTVEIRAVVVRSPNGGLEMRSRPKTKSGYRTLRLPKWAVDMLDGRLMVQDENPMGLVFTAARGGLRSPSKASSDLRTALDRKVLDENGKPVWPTFEWVTSHVFRKTVLTLMDLAGLPARAAADQAGHAKVSMTQDVYYGRGVADTGAADVLEAIGTWKPKR
jgi:integrase